MANYFPRTSAQNEIPHSAFDAGRKPAAEGLAKHGHSLCLMRDVKHAGGAR